MDKKSKEALRRYKKSRQAQSSSESSSSSDSDSGSSSSYSSSESDRRRRHKKSRQTTSLRRSTSSSDERHKREKRDREHCQKKLEAKRNHLKRKLKEAKLKKKAAAAAAALSGHSHRALSPATQAKLKKLAERKHLRAASKERREREKEKHRAALREREREHHRAGSRSPTKITKIRIHQDVKRQKSPPRMHHQLMSREKIIIQTRTRDRTPSAERERQRHDHKLRHEDLSRERERREREAARDKERAEALARCQERQRERERLAREKLRREEEEKYGKAPGPDRLIPRGSERDVTGVRPYDSRERSMEHSKREMDPYEHGYIRKHRTEPDFEDESERRPHMEREELLRQREYLARRREISPVEYASASGTRVRGDPRDLYPDEERERPYKRPYEDTTRGHPTNREAWVTERELRERELHDHPRDYRDIEAERMYPDERERLPTREGRERPPFVGRPASEWKRDWSSPRERNEWQGDEGGQSTSGRGIGFVGGPKRGGAVGIVNKVPQIVQQRERPPSEPDWDTEEGQIDTPKKSEGTPKRDWIEHDQREVPLNREKLLPASRPWNPNDWRDGEEASIPSSGYQRGPPGIMMHHLRSDRGGRGGYRGRGGHIDHGERMPGHGFRPHHPPALINLPVPPPGYHGVGPMPRFPNKRNMTYTNPNILKKQQAALAAAKAAAQASAVAAATTAVAAAKAAAQSAANATTNPGILGQVSSNRPQASDEKPEAGEIVGDIDQKEESLSSVATGNVNSEQKEKRNSGELSEISDSDDDILNKTEKKTKIENEDSNSQAKQENKEIGEVKEDEEEIMDFEEISDGELEEERAARGVGDALGVDWSSLVAETKRVPSNLTTTAKQKWQPHRIILDVGISMRMASEEYAKRLLNKAKQQLDEELQSEVVKTETKLDIKSEIKDEVSSLSTLDEDSRATPLENDDSNCDTKSKEELDYKNDIKPLTEEIVTETFNVDILPPLACMQVSQQKLQIERRQLITNVCGINSRALSARQDLKLRRQLCGLPARECDITRNIPQTSDKLKAMAAFQRTLQVK